MSMYSVVATPICGLKGCLAQGCAKCEECEFLRGFEQPGKKTVVQIKIKFLCQFFDSAKQPHENSMAFTHHYEDEVDYYPFKAHTTNISHTTNIFPMMEGVPIMKMILHAWLWSVKKNPKNVTKIFIDDEPITPALAEEYIEVYSGPPKNPMTFDIGVLLNTNDLRVDNTTPAWYRDDPWFVIDDACKAREKVQQRPYLYSGKKPINGQRLEIGAQLPNTSWGQLSGQVTRVLASPSYEEASKFCAPHHHWDDKSRGEALKQWGAVHGQQVEGIVSLNFSHQYKKDLVKFFRGGEETHYRVLLWCHHCKTNMWQIMQIKPVQHNF